MAMMVKETDEQLTQALGAAVVQIWSYLPPGIQHELFEEAISCLGEADAPSARAVPARPPRPHRLSDARPAGAGQPRRLVPDS